MSDIVEYSGIMDMTGRYTHKISIDKTSLRTEVLEVDDARVMDVKIVGKVDILKVDKVDKVDTLTPVSNMKLGRYNFNYYREGNIQIPGQQLTDSAEWEKAYDLIPNAELIEIFTRIITAKHLHVILPKLEEYIKTHELRNNNEKLMIENKELQGQLRDLEKRNHELMIEKKALQDEIKPLHDQVVRLTEHGAELTKGGYKRRNTRRRNTRRRK